MTPKPEGRSRLDALARAIDGRLRRAWMGRVLSAAVLSAACAVTILEIAARVTVVPALRPLEAVALVLAAAAAAALGWRSRPASSDWRESADVMTAERGVFSATDAAARTTALSPLVLARAEAAAAEILAIPAASRPLSLRSRVAILAMVVAAATAVLPGLNRPAGELDPELQERLLAEIRALPDAVARGADPAERDLLARTAASLESRRYTADAARGLAERLGRTAHDQAVRDRALVDALATNPLLRDLAEALRSGDPAALERALTRLEQTVRRAEPRSPSVLEAASRLLELAASESDPALKRALADAGQALAGSGSGGAEQVKHLGPPLASLMTRARATRDFVVTLEAAAERADQGGAGANLRPSSTDRRAAPPETARGTAAGALPLPPDYRALARPGTSDEAVLKRYFAIPE